MRPVVQATPVRAFCASTCSVSPVRGAEKARQPGRRCAATQVGSAGALGSRATTRIDGQPGLAQAAVKLAAAVTVVGLVEVGGQTRTVPLASRRKK